MDYVKIEKFSLENQGGFVSKIQIWYMDNEGQEQLTGHLTGDIDIGSSATVDISQLDIDIQEGSTVRIRAYVEAGNDKDGPQSFTYTKNGATASYLIAGTTLDNRLGLMEPSPFLEPIKIGYLSLDNRGGYVANIYLAVKFNPAQEWSFSWHEGSDKGISGNIPLGQTGTVDPKDLLDGSIPYALRIMVRVMTGADCWSDIVFLYEQGNNAQANFVCAGTTRKAEVGLIDISEHQG